MNNLHIFVSIAILLVALLANKTALKKVVTKLDPAKKLKLDFVPKKTVDQVQDGNNPMTIEDPFIIDISRSRLYICLCLRCCLANHACFLNQLHDLTKQVTHKKKKHFDARIL